jgi:uncharacterized protein RhaS with RHS repeats
MKLVKVFVLIIILANLTFSRRFYDPEIGMWISVDPVNQHFSPYIYGSNNPVNRIDPDGAADYGTQENYIAAANAVIGNKDFLPSAGTTHCNEGTMAIVNTGLSSPLVGYANDIAKMLTDANFATPITADQAVAYAQQGVTPLAAWQNPKGGHGHVAAVAPSTDSKGRPNVFNIGLKNAFMSIAEAFGLSKRESKTFGYYILNEDLNSLNTRSKTGD